MDWNDFSRIIDIHIKKYPNDPNYFDWLNNGVWGNWRKGSLTEKDVNIIIEFLKNWKMGRVLGKIRKKVGNENFISSNIELAEKTSSLFGLSNNYEFNYEVLNFTELRSLVIELFSDISHLLKSTSASKILHMVNPNLFIMWDEKIRNYWGCEENENGYMNFLIRMNLEYRELINNFAKIEQLSIAEADKNFLQNLNQRIERNIPITRWVDIYNWTKFTRKEKL